jgi:hypothetical protein
VAGNSLSDQAEFLRKLYTSDKVDEGLSYDFVGPAFDIGFRLTNFSTDKKMHIDVGTAYLLCHTFSELSRTQLSTLRHIMPDDIGIGGKSLDDRLKIYYSGSEMLKGVGGVKYPKLWINSGKLGTSETLKEELIFPEGRPSVGFDNLFRYCKTFYDERARSISKPFVAKDGSLTAADMPSDYQQVRSQMQDEFIEENLGY